MKKIVVFGSTGYTGLCAVRAAIEHGKLQQFMNYFK